MENKFLNEEKIREFARSRYATDAEFARAVGYAKSYVSGILSGKLPGSRKFVAELKRLGMTNRDIFMP